MASQVNRGRARAELVTGRGRGPGLPLPQVRPQASCCPVGSCGELIDPCRLMCRHHWYLVPKQVISGPNKRAPTRRSEPRLDASIYVSPASRTAIRYGCAAGGRAERATVAWPWR